MKRRILTSGIAMIAALSVSIPAASAVKVGYSANGITYQGGAVMTGTTTTSVNTIYPIWYGNWGNYGAAFLFADFITNLNKSPWMNVLTTYSDKAGKSVKNTIALGRNATDPKYSRGKSLSDADVEAIIASKINKGELPKDPNGIYILMGSKDVKETSGFLTNYCAYHAYITVGGQRMKYQFVGDASANLAACSIQPDNSPNGVPAIDAMLNVTAHEIAETITDPEMNAWQDNDGYEVADKCAWTFGTTKIAPNGSQYNMVLGTRKYLIQQIWVNKSGGYCSIKY